MENTRFSSSLHLVKPDASTTSVLLPKNMAFLLVECSGTKKFGPSKYSLLHLGGIRNLSFLEYQLQSPNSSRLATKRESGLSLESSKDFSKFHRSNAGYGRVFETLGEYLLTTV